MREKRTAYIVTCGEYSDYSISAVFLDKALADRYAEAMNRDSDRRYETCRVEEYEISEHVGRRVAVHVADWSVGTGLSWWAEWEWEEHAPARPQIMEFPHRGGGFRVSCVDRELARKAFQDRLARFQAQRAGVTD